MCLKTPAIRCEGANVKTPPLAEAQHIAVSKFGFSGKSRGKKSVAALAVDCPGSGELIVPLGISQKLRENLPAPSGEQGKQRREVGRFSSRSPSLPSFLTFPH